MSTELRVEKLFSHKNTMLTNHNKNSSRNRNDKHKEHKEEGKRLETQLQHLVVSIVLSLSLLFTCS